LDTGNKQISGNCSLRGKENKGKKIQTPCALLPGIFLYDTNCSTTRKAQVV